MSTDQSASAFALTWHAVNQMDARSLSVDAVSSVLAYGRHAWTRGARIFVIGRREVEHYRALGLHLDPYEGVQVVTTADGAILTVYRNRRPARHAPPASTIEAPHGERLEYSGADSGTTRNRVFRSGSRGGSRGVMNAAPAPYEPDRRSILDVLQTMGLPVPVSLMRDLIVAGGGLSPSPKHMARMLHRDERRFTRSLPLPEDGLVPGISAFGLVAVASTVALAAWPTEQRILGPRTARIVYLRSRLVLPGGQAVELDRSRTAARDELPVLEPLDLEERLSAAARLAVVPERYRFWGRPALIETATDRGRSLA